MLLDVRTYKIRPGCMAQHLALYEQLGYAAQVRHIGEPLCYASAESGEMNTIVHIWVYESAADREQKRARMMQDPEWKNYLTENAKAGFLIEQKTSLMTPASFAPPIPKRTV